MIKQQNLKMKEFLTSQYTHLMTNIGLKQLQKINYLITISYFIEIINYIK